MSARMRRYRFAAGCRFLGVALACALLSSRVFAQEPCATPSGRVISVQGLVEISRAGEPRWQPASLEDRLCANDRVRVEAKGRAAIRLANETIVRLDRGTTITFPAIEREERSWVQILKGALHFISRVPRSLDIRTPYVNAAIEGTELAVTVREGETALWVFEGQVRATNAQGELVLVGGDSAVAKAGEAPQRRIVVEQRDAVQWALHYPPLVDFQRLAREDQSPEMLAAANRYYAGDVAGALSAVDAVPGLQTSPALVVLRASLNLALGEVSAAQHQIESVTKGADESALRSVIALANGDTERALTLAEDAVRIDPDSFVARSAKSYALQSSFRLDEARLEALEAVRIRKDDALAQARLAEIELALGNRDAANAAAHSALELNPEVSRTHAVAGFSLLTGIRVQMAQARFDDAIRLDQTDPLPRLGRGLALIRAGQLARGREDLELAASLDPNNSLVRSYLGKAYFEERRSDLADVQLQIAKELDPRDPTPWFYDAIAKQSANRPVEALKGLKRSIELNDNRAPYRSRMLLDDDNAARSASLGRVFGDLEFQNLALLEGWKSISVSPESFSGHRLLSDAYAALPRHEVARVSELFQSQMLQPINLTPLQPQLAQSNLGILSGVGPSDPSTSEFNQYFVRNDISVQGNAVVGSNNTFGEDLVLSGLYNQFALSVGQFHFESNGFRANNDQNRDLVSVFGQAAVTEATSVQVEYRRADNKSGDLRLRFRPQDVRLDRRDKDTSDLARVGLRHTFSPRSTALVSVAHTDLKLNAVTPTDRFDRHDKGVAVELQHLYSSEPLSIVSGFSFLSATREETLVLDLGPLCAVIDCERRTDQDTDHFNAYVYANVEVRNDLRLSLGLSFDNLDNAVVKESQINPKIGLTWTPVPTTIIRVGAFRSLQRDLINDQTLEPTQVAGFNQFFDDARSSKAWRYGIGLDHAFNDKLYGGFEYSQRDLDVPIVDVATNSILSLERDEFAARGYVYWTPKDWMAISAEYLYDRFENHPRVADEILNLDAHRVPLTLSLNWRTGWSVQAKTTFVRQEIDFLDRTAAGDVRSDDEDSFWVLDLEASYRFAKRRGRASLSVLNVFDREFRYEEFDRANPQFAPERAVFGRVTLSF